MSRSLSRLPAPTADSRPAKREEERLDAAPGPALGDVDLQPEAAEEVPTTETAPTAAAPRMGALYLGPASGGDGATDDGDLGLGGYQAGVLRQASSAGTPAGDPDAAFGAATAGPGTSVPYQSKMESAFGEDFSGVTAHVGQQEPLADLGANAAASGETVAFASASPSQETVAHEMTHVVQQRRAGSQPVQGEGSVSSPSDASEREATAVGAAVASTGRAPEITAAPGAGLAREEASQAPQFPPGFDAGAQAEKLHAAMDGWGTDERAIHDALWTGRRDMTQAIEAAYNARYSPPLEEALHSELSGDALARALSLLGHGQLTLRDKVREAVDGWGTNEEQIFHGLEVASPEELVELKADAALLSALRGDMNDDDWALCQAYLNGQGALASKLRRAVNGWGTDEAAIWRALQQATPEEKQFVLSQPSLLSDLRGDMDDADWLKCERMLRGTLTAADKVLIAMEGWGTDEAGLSGALEALTAADLTALPADIDTRLEAEVSGDELVKAKEILHQKRLAFDGEYRKAWEAGQAASLGEGALQDEGASVLKVAQGESMSAVGRLRAACEGAGTDDETVWKVLSSLTESERRFIRERNPEGILGTLEGDLSDGDYQKALQLLGGGAGSAAASLKVAVDGWGTDLRVIYNAIDRAIAEGTGSQILGDAEVLSAVQGDVSEGQFHVFRQALTSGTFTPLMRLQWATDMAGTDEDLIWELCGKHGSQWYRGGQLDPQVDAILQRELSTTDYWKALDLIRGEPATEEEKLARSKEKLERERGGGFWNDVSGGIMDSMSDSGENADDAWREYQGTYNQSMSDGQVSEDEKKKLGKAEEYAQYTLQEYQAAKAAVSQWATTIAVAIVGIAATILTGGAAGPFVAALGGKLAVAAEAMVLAASLKVGLNKAIQGEGYDLTSTQALVDAVSASVEVGLNMVGGQVAMKFVEGAGKVGICKAVGPAVERVFGPAGKQILTSGLEGAVDGTIGGIGEGLIQGMAQDQAWTGVEGFLTTVGSSVGTNALMSGAAGGITAMGFASIGQTFGGNLKGQVADDAPGVKVDGDAVDGATDNVANDVADGVDGAGGRRPDIKIGGDDLDGAADDVANGVDNVGDDVGIKQPGGDTPGVRTGSLAAQGDSSVDLAAQQKRVLELQQQGAYQDAGFHGTSSDALDGLAQTDGSLLSAQKLRERQVAQVTGEGDAFSGASGLKKDIFIGHGEAGFGTSLAYADAAGQLSHYNIQRYTLGELQDEIGRLQRIVDNYEGVKLDFDPHSPMGGYGFKDKAQFLGQLSKLQKEMDLRMKLPSGHPRRVGGPENVSNYPLMFEFDTSGMDVRMIPGRGGPGQALSGEGIVADQIDLRTTMRRVYCPADKVDEVTARMSGILGHQQFEVIAFEALDALPRAGATTATRDATLGALGQLQKHFEVIQAVWDEAIQQGKPVTVIDIISRLQN